MRSSAQNLPLTSHLIPIKPQDLAVASKVPYGAPSLPLPSLLPECHPLGFLDALQQCQASAHQSLCICCSISNAIPLDNHRASPLPPPGLGLNVSFSVRPLLVTQFDTELYPTLCCFVVPYSTYYHRIHYLLCILSSSNLLHSP